MIRHGIQVLLIENLQGNFTGSTTACHRMLLALTSIKISAFGRPRLSRQRPPSFAAQG